ncbi:WD40 repeat domain-containing protein [Candidatus Dependentiae bacterium]
MKKTSIILFTVLCLCSKTQYCMKYLAAAIANKQVKIWDKNFKDVKTLDTENTPYSVIFINGDKFLAVALSENIDIYDTKNWKKIHTIKNKKSDIFCLKISNDNKYLAGGDYANDKINIWKIKNIKNFVLKKTLDDGECFVNSMAFSNNNKYFAFKKNNPRYQKEDCVISIRDIPYWQEITEDLNVPKGEDIQSILFTNDDTHLISCSNVNRKDTIKIWPGSTIGCFSNPVKHDCDDILGIVKEIVLYKLYVTSLAISKNNKYLAMGGAKKIKILDLEKCKIPAKTNNGHKSDIRSIAFVNKDKNVLSASMDNTIKLWSLDKSLKEKNKITCKDSVLSIALSTLSKNS